MIVGVLTAPLSALAAAVLYFELRGPTAGGPREPDPSRRVLQAGGVPARGALSRP